MAHQIWVILFKSVIMPLTDLISWKTVNNVKNILQNQTIETLISGKPDDHTDMNKYSFCVCQALNLLCLKITSPEAPSSPRLHTTFPSQASEAQFLDLLYSLTDCFFLLYSEGDIFKVIFSCQVPLRCSKYSRRRPIKRTQIFQTSHSQQSWSWYVVCTAWQVPNNLLSHKNN